MNTIDKIYRTAGSKASQYIADRMPSLTISSEKTYERLKWIGKHITSPENRLILGISALMSQPFIDLYNHKVDEETRKTSAARTVAKIIAGTTTGYLVRYLCIKGIDGLTHLPEEAKNLKHPKLARLLTPDLTKTVLKDLKQYKNTIGTYLSLGVMIVTNFMVDAPLTKYLTNKFIDKIKKNEEKKQGQKSNVDKVKEDK